MPFGVIFGALTVYAVSRVIGALGFGFLVYSGLNALHDQFYQNVFDHLGQTPQAVLQIASLFGFVEGSQIILAAVSVRIAFLITKKFGPLPS